MHRSHPIRARRSGRPDGSHRPRRLTAVLTAAAALTLVAGVTTVGLAPAASAAAPTTWYAYPSGAAPSPTTCPRVTQAADLAGACTLADALSLAPSGDHVALAADPGAGDTATFTTDTGWTIDQDSLFIAPDDGVAATLDGQHTAPYLLKYTGTTQLQVNGLTVATGSTGGDDSTYTTIPILIENSAGSGDLFAPGGAIVNAGSGSVSLLAATVRGNASNGGLGGGLVNMADGIVGASATTFSDNATTAGGQGGGLVNMSTGSAQALSSTFTGNDTTDGGHGGGISAIGPGPVRVLASTFTANATGGSSASGGGIHSASGNLEVVASTFTDNGPAGTRGADGMGGGLVATSGSVTGSLFAGNGPDCAGTITDAGYNLDSDGSCGFRTDNHSASHVTTLPGTLNPLADNGGPTETIAPQLGSPAAGFIPTTATGTLEGATGSFPLCAVDQRNAGGQATETDRPCNAGSVHSTVGGERQAPITLYAYPGGAAYWPVDCPQVTDLAQGCGLTDAIRLAQSGDTVALAADPGSSTATFTTDTGWTVAVDSLTIEPDGGVAATLDGHHTAPFLLHYTGGGDLDQSGAASSVGTLTVDHVAVTGSSVTADTGIRTSGSTSVGGGIVTTVGGTFHIGGSTFTDNITTGGTGRPAEIGGGIVMAGQPATVTVADSTFTGNTTDTRGQITFGGGIVGFGPGHSIAVTGSTFSGNDVTNDTTGGPAIGGGIVAFSVSGNAGTLAVDRSTFAANTVAATGIGPGAIGGGIVNSGNATIIASTFARNTIDASTGQAIGGGIVNASQATLAGNLLAGNASDCQKPGGGQPVTLVDAGYNIDSDGSCGLTAATHSLSDSAGLAATLGALKDNGGPTETIEPLHGSPAAGMIPATTSMTVDGKSVTLCPATDQRGTPSTAGTACNAGSVQSVQAGKPGAPTGLAATAGDGSVHLQWTAPADTGGAAVSYHLFQATTAGGAGPTPITANPITGTSHTVTGLVNGTTYYFTVKAVNSAGSSGASNEASATPKAVPAHVSVKAGNHQSARSGTDFAARLAAAVTNKAGDPVGAGVPVTFTVTTGSASFAGNASAAVTTDGSGVATSPALVAGTAAGTVTVTATVTNVDPPVTVAFDEIVTPAPCAGNPFKDVSPDDPNCAYVNWMVDTHVTSGYPGDLYKPDYQVTRQTMAAFLYRLAHGGNHAPDCTTAPFTDVPTSNPFCGAITWLVGQGATNGFGDGTFRPTQAVTNQTSAAFLYRLSHQGEQAPTCSSTPFTDVSTSNPFCGAISWAADRGIVTGSNGLFGPTDVVTRGSVAPVLFRYSVLPAVA